MQEVWQSKHAGVLSFLGSDLVTQGWRVGLKKEDQDQVRRKKKWVSCLCRPGAKEESLCVLHRPGCQINTEYPVKLEL